MASATKGSGWPRRQRSFNLVNLGGLKRVCRSGRGAVGGGRRPTSFFSRVWVSSRVLVEREGRGVLRTSPLTLTKNYLKKRLASPRVLDRCDVDSVETLYENAVVAGPGGFLFLLHFFLCFFLYVCFRFNSTFSYI